MKRVILQYPCTEVASILAVAIETLNPISISFVISKYLYTMITTTNHLMKRFCILMETAQQTDYHLISHYPC